MTERTTVLGAFTRGETEIFAERAAVWTRCQQVWEGGYGQSKQLDTRPGACAFSVCASGPAEGPAGPRRAQEGPHSASTAPEGFGFPATGGSNICLGQR